MSNITTQNNALYVFYLLPTYVNQNYKLKWQLKSSKIL